MSSREKNLLSLFLIALGIIALFFVHEKLNAWDANLASKEKDIALQENEFRAYSSPNLGWEKRRQWLNENLPLYQTEGNAVQDLFDRLNQASGKNQMTVKDLQFLDTKTNKSNQEKSNFLKAGAKIKTQSSFEGLIAWLHEIQQPENFTSIIDFKLQPDTENTELVNAEIQLIRYYKLAPEN